MNKKDKGKKKLKKADLAPENFVTKEEHEAALEQYRNQTNYFQFFFGDHSGKKANQEGKPTQPPY